jgi:hypothetical protein
MTTFDISNLDRTHSVLPCKMDIGSPSTSSSPLVLRHSSSRAPGHGKDKRCELRRAKTPDPKKVLQSFNTWAFKREQPSDPELMLEVISGSISRAEPIPFVLYWGKGPRREVDHPDLKCLDYLATLAIRVREAYEPGAAIRLIFTDTHAKLNGHSHQTLLSYFGEVDAAARQRGFESCWLSQLTRAAEAAAIQPDEDMVPERMLLSLSSCAAKWFRGEGTPEQGALKYYQMNMLEKRAVERAFPCAVFITFNG